MQEIIHKMSEKESVFFGFAGTKKIDPVKNRINIIQTQFLFFINNDKAAKPRIELTIKSHK